MRCLLNTLRKPTQDYVHKINIYIFIYSFLHINYTKLLLHHRFIQTSHFMHKSEHAGGIIERPPML